ncbi:FAD-dependent monooxygenase [Phaeobacter marinintestinus]|uniref:FAD-dependent monooxygenase n=1 Tax=Falsiphaeobacter marinintestinus TaxID=1492905 RepID=UPI0011B422A7|nr:FAD-dependent monooxygenase [Phaeobacter marinintestinus]
MALNGQHIIVIGGGIGGLAAALAFRQRGASVTVLEQAEAVTEVGAGLQISPNGFAVIRALELDAALAQNSVRARAVVLRDYRKPGEVLRLDLARFAADQHFRFVHRADLITILANAARDAGVQIRLLQKVASVEAGPEPVVRLCSGADKRADLVIGADGLHSKAREALNEPDSPVFTGQVAWRAIVPNDPGLPAEAQVFMGPGRHMVCYPLRGGSVVNIVAAQERAEWATESWSHRDDPKNLRRAFSEFDGTARALLERVEDVALWGLFRHPVAETWHKGRVAILGDAAHPTLPFLAQGANMALEDAWVLADCLDGAETTGAGLSAYQARRRDRVVRAIKAANGNAWKYHLSIPPVRGAAHLALKLGGRLAPKRMLGQFDWLYRHDVTRG